MERRRVAVGVVTYHRESLLAELLPMLEEQARQVEAESADRCQVSVVVVDNDPAGSARRVAEAAQLERLTYCIESSPGVTAARNRVLDECADQDLLVFIDDDETPHEGWLHALLSCADAFNADVVAGPVHSVFVGSVDPWVVASGSYLRLHRAGLHTGDPIVRAATNNLLVDLGLVRRLGLRFDERFGLTGGEDSFFTGQLQAAGATMVWCTEAIVDDLVPSERMNRDYNLRRRFSMANASGRAEILLAPGGGRRLARRGEYLARGVAQVTLGTVLAVRGRVWGPLERRAKGERYVMGGLGSAAASVGLRVSPYRRKKAPKFVQPMED